MSQETHFLNQRDAHGVTQRVRARARRKQELRAVRMARRGTVRGSVKKS